MCFSCCCRPASSYFSISEHIFHCSPCIRGVRTVLFSSRQTNDDKFMKFPVKLLWHFGKVHTSTSAHCRIPMRRRLRQIAMVVVADNDDEFQRLRTTQRHTRSYEVPYPERWHHRINAFRFISFFPVREKTNTNFPEPKIIIIFIH